MSVSVVVQRFRECKLLIDEAEYITVGNKGGSDSCGLLAYVSFASSATQLAAEQAAQTLLNLPVCTTGLWGDRSCGESTDTVSVLTLSADPTAACSLVIVPQANLISKVKQQGKSIQYHGQISKEKGQDLYEYFCDSLRGKLLEAQYSLSGNQDLPKWYQDRKAYFAGKQNNDNKQTACPSTPPNELFRDETKYSQWDADGIPITDAEGQALSKSQLKKVKKVYEAHCKRHEKWKAQHQDGDGDIKRKSEKSTIGANDEPPAAQWDDSLDPSFCHFVAGSFGKRQGLEMKSDMGPFVHSFTI